MNHPVFTAVFSICTFFITLSFFTCTKSVPVRELLASADSILYKNADSAEIILDNIRETGLPEKEYADYWRLRTKLHTSQGKATVEDSMIVYALEYYKNHRMKDEMKESYKLALNHLSWKNDSINYNRYMNEALKFGHQENDSIFIGYLLRVLAFKNYNKNNYSHAYQNYVEATKYGASHPMVFYMAALSYSSGKKKEGKDTIDYWMQKGIEIAKRRKDTLSLHHIYRNYADIQERWKNYDDAIDNIRNMRMFSKTTETFHIEPYMLAKIHFQKHNMDSAQYYLNEMLKQDFGDDKNRSFGLSRKGLAIFQSMINHAKGGSFDFSLMGRYTDSLYFDQRDKRLIMEEQVYTKQRLEKQNLELTIKRQRMQMTLFVVVFILITGIFICYLYIRKKREKLYWAEEKMESLQKLLSDVANDIENARSNSSFFKRIMLQQLGIIRYTASNPTKENQDMLVRMAKITNNEIPVESLIVWDDLYSLTDSLYDNFYTKMKNAFGNVLSEKEIQLCCLLCAGFTTKEISVLSQQSLRTVYQRKSTVRDKLKMDRSENIPGFIKEHS